MQGLQTNIKTEKTTRPMDSSQPTEPMVQPIAKRLRTHEDPDDHALVHCPRCDSSDTKFCYYNNYSLSQPRYFCKSCRRYWTKGGTLRNIPVGGVSRRNKKFSFISKPNHNHRHQQQPQQQPQQHDPPYNKLAILPDVHVNEFTRNSTGLQVSYPESPMEFSPYPDFMFENLTTNFMEMGSGRGGDNEGGDCFPTILENGYGADTGNTHGLSPFGEAMAYYHEHYDKMINLDDEKQRQLELKMDWRDHMGCYSDIHGSDVGRNGSNGLSFGSSWAGLMNGYGSSSTNSLA